MASFLWSAANSLAGAFGCELRSRRRNASPAFTMDAALERLRTRQLPINGIIDVGAAVGRWSRKAMRSFPGAHYLLFEPLEERRAALEGLRASSPNVNFVIAAAGDHAGSVTFNVSSDLDGSGIYGDAQGAPREVPLTTIDAEVARTQLPAPYLLKLDTHGFEVPILAGAHETLAKTQALLIEGYNFQLSPGCLRFHELCAHVETLGFRCAELVDPMLRPDDSLLWQLDLLFLRQDAPFFTHTQYQYAAHGPGASP